MIKFSLFFILFSLSGIVLSLSTIKIGGTSYPSVAGNTFAYSNLDGTGGNPSIPTSGSVGDVLQYTSNSWPDNKGAMATDLPNPRDVSNQLFAYGSKNYSISRLQLSNLHSTFGQFVMRDIINFDKTSGTESADIKVPKCDRIFDPSCLGTASIPFKRLNPTQNNPRNFANKATTWLDLSQVYGTSVSQNDQYREKSGGRMKYSNQTILPLNTNGAVLNGVMNDTSLFLGADPRLNQDITLISWVALFIMRHNSWASQISLANPNMGDDDIFYEARRRTIFEYQNVVYNEYLTNILFDQPLSGYDAKIKPNLSPEFVMASYFGHHTVPSFFNRMQSTTVSSTDGPFLLRDSMWNKRPAVSKQDIAETFIGLLTDASKEPDSIMIDDLRNFFYNPNGVITDLAAMSIQRGRDIGCPYYNDVRRKLEYYEPITSFSQLTSNPDLIARATKLYPDIEKLDLYVGLMIESVADGQSIQVTTEAIIRNQLSQVLSSDYFWYSSQSRNRTTIAPVPPRGYFNSVTISSLLKEEFPEIALYVQNRGFVLPTRSSFSSVPTAPEDPDYDGIQVFDEGYSMYWRFFNYDKIHIKLLIKGTGWAGLGLNPSDNKMSNMSIIIGRVLEGGKADIGVYHTNAVGDVPVAVNDVPLGDLAGSQTEGTTTISFSMPVRTHRWNLFPPGKPAGYSCSFAFNAASDDIVFHGPSRGNQLVYWAKKNYKIVIFLNGRNPFINQYKLAVNKSITDFFKQPLPYGENINLEALWIDTNGSQAIAVSTILSISESNSNVVAYIGGETLDDTTAVSYVLLNNKNVQLSPFVRDDNIAISNTSFLFRTTNKYSTQVYSLIHAIDQAGIWKEVAVLYSPDQYDAYLEFRDKLSTPRETATYPVSINYTMAVDYSNLDYRLSNLVASRTAVLVALISSEFWPLLLTINSTAARAIFQPPYVWLCSDGLLDAIENGTISPDDPRFFGFITTKERPQNEQMIRQRLGIPASETLDYGTGTLYDTIGALGGAIRQLILQNKTPLNGTDLKLELQKAKFIKTNDSADGTGFDMLLSDSYSFDQNNQLGVCSYVLLNIFNGSLYEASNFSCADVSELGNWTYIYPDGSMDPPRSDIPRAPVEVFWVHWSDGIAIAVIALTAACLVLHFLILLGLIAYRNERVVKSSSSLFLYLIWSGMLVGYCFNFVWTAEPSSFVCNFRPWFASVGFCLMYGSLLLKAYRNWTVVGLSDVTKIASFSNNKLAPYIGGLWSIYAIMLIVWSSYDPLYVDPNGPNKSDNTVTKRCYSDHHTAFVIALMSYTGIILIAGLFFAYKSRNNKGEYSESRWVSLTIFNFTLTAVSVIPVTFAIYNLPLVAYLVLGFGLIWVNLITTITFFVPKMFYIYESAGDGRWQDNRSTRRGTL